MTDIVLLSELYPIVEATLHAAGLVTARLYEAADPGAFFASHAPTARGAAGSFGRRIDAALMDRLPRLEIIANFGVGYETVDVAAAAARSIVVTNTPDVLTEEVADTTLGLMLATVRELPGAERHLSRGALAERSVPPHGHPARQDGGHLRPWPHRQGGREALRSIRPPRRVPRAKAASGRDVRVPRHARGARARGRHPRRDGACERRDEERGRRRRARCPRSGGYAHQRATRWASWSQTTSSRSFAAKVH